MVVAGGDEIWRSSDGGRTVERVLQLSNGEALGGLAFGTAPGTLYVAGTSVYIEPGKPPGTLFISRDGGATWAPPIASGSEGPHYKCLTASAGKLYACESYRGSNTDPMVQESSNEGATWTPALRLADVSGPKSCVAEACQTVAAWLCDKYQVCSERGATGTVDAGAAVDASAGDTGDEAGCGCGVGRASSAFAGNGAALVMLGLALLRVTRRHWGKVSRTRH